MPVPAQSVFQEGSGSLLTDGTRACMDTAPEHLAYGVPISGGDAGEIGLRITMDDQGVYCGHGSMLAVGHLAGHKYLSYGDFEWRGRIHHSPDGSGPPANSFTCFSTFVHGEQPHNEIAWCFPPTNGHEVHMSYWYDDRMHQTVRKLAVDLTQGIHKYTVRWRDVGLDWLIDDVIVHKVRGTAGVDVPTTLEVSLVSRRLVPDLSRVVRASRRLPIDGLDHPNVRAPDVLLNVWPWA